MGLDMFLDKTKRISEDIKEYEGVSWQPIGYWRKANQIHNWFVNNIQDGNDDCEPYEVTYEDLIKLRQVTEEALALKDSVLNGSKVDVKKVEELLPTMEGFFFGSTTYDEYYFEDLKETLEIIDNALASTNFVEEIVVYNSWW